VKLRKEKKQKGRRHRFRYVMLCHYVADVLFHSHVFSALGAETAMGCLNSKESGVSGAGKVQSSDPIWGRYDRIRILGQGASANVWLARPKKNIEVLVSLSSTTADLDFQSFNCDTECPSSWLSCSQNDSQKEPTVSCYIRSRNEHFEIVGTPQHPRGGRLVRDGD
jgi:hypothetical protein